MAQISYTAEQINHRLDLINENKNLLEYHYNDNFLSGIEGLEDVGDGSILTTTYNTKPNSSIELKSFSLRPGDYIVSIDITDVINDSIQANPGFGIAITGVTVQNNQFTLTEPTVITVALTMPNDEFAIGLLVKPMIRIAGTEPGWKPYMGAIDSYVDERFNSTNTKLRDVLAFMKLVDIVDVVE